MKFKILSLILALTANPAAAHANEALDELFTSGTAPQSLRELDKATSEKWSQLEDWQQKSSWINEQVRLGVVGVVYEKGMFGSTVSRNIVPDKGTGWLVVDTVQVNAGPLLQLGNLAGNIFLQEYFPYLQVGANFERSYTNVRHKDTYKDALLANPFKFRTLPVNAAALGKLEQGEIVSTITQGGLFVKAGASIFDLLGVSIADGAVTLGPKVKIHVNKRMKLTLAKQSASEVLVLLEDAVETGFGIGLAAGFLISDAIDAPISIGINQDNGWSPLRINYKENKEKLKSLIYKLNIDTADGQAAYTALMNRDLSVLDDMNDRGSQGVVKELVRNGVKNTSEFNMGLDLIFYRSGYRNIYSEAKYNSTIAGGKRFEYVEMDGEKIKESSSWGGGKQRDEKYSALVPLEAGKDSSFLVDTSFSYSDSSTDGKDLKEILARMKRAVNNLPINPTVDLSKDYGQVKAYLLIRFPADAIRSVLTASEQDVWRALAMSVGMPNTDDWATSRGRQLFLEGDRAKEQDPMTREVTGGPRYEMLQRAAMVRDFLREVRAESDPVTQARMLVKELKSDNREKLLHRVMVELAGRDQLLIRGRVLGERTEKSKAVKEKEKESCDSLFGSIFSGC